MFDTTTWEPQGLGKTIFTDRYAHSKDETWQEACRRVATHIASAEDNGKFKVFEQQFYEQLVNNKLMPGGRIWYGAGRPKAQLLNCLAGDTLVHTDRGMVAAQDLVGQVVNVLSDGGVYRRAEWFNYGKQRLYQVILANGDEIFATAEHQWIVTKPKGGTERVKTIDLVGRHIPVQHVVAFDYDEDEYNEGVRHGLAFGDGAIISYGTSVELRQFGDSREIVPRFFDEYRETHYGQPTTVVSRLPLHYKSLPEGNESVSYLRGFLAGWIAADGCVDSRGHVMLHNKDYGNLVMARRWAAKCGIPTISIAKTRSLNPWTGEEAPMYKLTFVKAAMYDDRMVVKQAHRDKMFNSPIPHKNTTVKVKAVLPTDRVEDVYCCVEPETHSFVIEAGYLTGNCFVVPTHDSREGWGKTTSDVIIISGLMGGVGINVSPIRPRGTLIQGTGGHATGAVSLMHLIDGVGDVIVGGGGRRMALMLCLDLNHPDVEEFLHSKLNLDELNNANISIVIPDDMPTDEFVQKVKNDEMIELMFNGVPSGKSIKARWLWDVMVENAWQSGEPGLLNGYLANQMNNIHYYRPLISTNPCVTGDTWVMTEYGPRQVQDIVGEPMNLWVNGELYPSTDLGFFETGVKQVFELQTTEGYTLKLTENHQVLTDEGWREASKLQMGDKILLHNHEGLSSWEGAGSFDDGYLVGHFLGDGTTERLQGSEMVRLCSWGDTQGEHDVRTYIEKVAFSLVHRADFQGWRDRGKYFSLTSSGVTQQIRQFFYGNVNKEITTLMHRASSEFQIGLISALFDTDGHVEGHSDKGGISIRISQSDLDFLRNVQIMLLRFGIRSKLQKARDGGPRLMPDGNGGLAEYNTKDNWRLIISSDVERFLEIMTPFNSDKLEKVNERIHNMKRGFYNKPFAATFLKLTPLGEEMVYDVQVPNVNAFDANGIVAHNCGEIWLEEYGCCDLGALVLPRFVRGDGSFDWEALAESVELGVRFLDNVLTVNHYPLQEIRENCMNVRRIGLGVMGLHTMLLQMGMRYDDPGAFVFVDTLFRNIKEIAYNASIDLATEKGPFSEFDPRFLDSGFMKTMPEWIRHRIRKHGIRNCALLTIPPTGTTSMVAGVSSGIEPLPPAVYWRNYFKPNETGERELTRELVVEDSYHKYPDLIQSAIDVPVASHFEMQRVVQEHIDNAVSKTINLANDFPKDEFGDIWLEYLPYLKGTTVYRYGSRANEPINPVPREQWDEVIASENRISTDSLTEEEFMALDCPDGVCELPQVK